MRKLEADEPLSKDECKGIVGRSPFLDLEYFDIVRDIPTEYLHYLCIGVVKRMVTLTFNVGVSRPPITTRRLTPTYEFNVRMSKMKVPRESSRRARTLDFSVYKGQEYRNLILFFFHNCSGLH